MKQHPFWRLAFMGLLTITAFSALFPAAMAAIGVAFGILLGAAFLGTGTLRLFWKGLLFGDALLLGTTLGLIEAAALAFLLAEVGWLYPAVMAGLAIPVLALGFPVCRRAWRTWEPALARLGGSSLSVSAWGLVAGAALLLFGGYDLAYGHLPPVLFDSLVNHLALPQQYLLDHEAVAFPHHLMSTYPRLHECLLLWPLAAGGATAANAFTVWLAFLALAWVARLTWVWEPRAAALAAALLISLPLFGYLACDVKNDMTLLLFETAALATLLVFSDTRRWLVAGLFLGAALATKSAALAALPGFALGAFLLPPESRRVTREFCLGGLLMLLVGAPFYLLAWAQTGSPLYPSFPDLFGAAPGLHYDVITREFQAVHSLDDALRLPYRLFFDPIKIDGDHAVIGAAWLLLLPFVAVLGRRLLATPWRVLTVVWLWQWVPMLAFSTKLRFYPLLFVLPVILIAAGLVRAARTRWTRACLAALVGGVLLYNLHWQINLADIFFEHGDEVLRGTMTEDAYLRSHNRAYDALQAAIAATGSDERLLLDGESRFAYVPRRVWVASPYEDGELDALAREGLSGAALDTRLAREGVAVILLGEPVFGRSPSAVAIRQGIAQRWRLVWHDDHRSVWRNPVP